jgi:GT2 family glycosyltransferase
MITASLVLHNTPKFLVERIIHSFNPSNKRKLFIIDNNSRDPDYKDLVLSTASDVTFIRLPRNIGYGSAHNIALKESIKLGADYHIVLNPDISFRTDDISNLAKYADEHKDVSYILPKVVYPSGQLQYLCKLLPTPFDLVCRRFLPNIGFIKRINDRYILKHSGYDKIINPPCLSGCFMFLRVSTLIKYNLFFDEGYFMYIEDFDLIRRIHRVSKTIFYPEITIVHDHEKGSYKNLRLLLIHIRSTMRYFNKYGWFFDRERKKMNNRIEDEIKNLHLNTLQGSVENQNHPILGS